MDGHGGDVLVETLIEHGVTHVFGVPGGQANAFYDALARRTEQITHILVRDERSAAYAADAMARVTHRIGVCDATVGPGSVKFPSGLMEAYNSSVPILAIVSDHPRNALLLQERGRISQGGDQLSVLRPFSKEVFHVPDAGTISEVVAAAIHKSITGRPGPTVVEIPQDVFEATSNNSIRRGPSTYPKLRITPLSADLRRASLLLTSASRPMILAGGGVFLSGAESELSEAAVALQAPVATTLSGKGLVPETGPSSLGVLGDFGNPAAKEIAEMADVVLIVGFKHSQNSTYRWTWPKPHQKIVHIDIDPDELGRTRTPDVPLWGDAQASLAALIEILKGVEQPNRTEWLALTRIAKSRWVEARDREIAACREPLLPQSVVAQLQAKLTDRDYLVCDASFASGWGAAYFEVAGSGPRVIFPRGAAGLGYSLPAAIGIAVVRPGARIVCLAGDGAFAYSLGELATVRARHLPVISIVLNNSSLAWAKWTQFLNFNGHNLSVDFQDVEFSKVATAFGIVGYDVRTQDELGTTLERALAAAEPAVINTWVDVREVPTLAYRHALAQRAVGRATSKAY